MRHSQRLVLAMLLAMPYTTKASILPLLAAFIAHWLRANAVLSTPISLTGGFLVAAMQTLLTNLEAILQDVADKESLEGGVRQAIHAQVELLHGMIIDYVPALKLRGVGAALLGGAPKMFTIRGGFDTVLATCRAFIAHWRRVNAALGASPLVIGTLTLAAFEDAVEALAALLQELANKTADATHARGQRDAAIEEALARCHQYVYAATIALRGHPELLNIIPKIRGESHATPDKPGLTAEPRMPPGVVALTVTPVSMDHFARVLIRVEAGSTTPTEESELAATLTDPASLVYTSPRLFQGPDATLTYRAWFVDTFGHQAASDPVTVSRPA